MAAPPMYPSLEEVTSLYKRLISEASTPLYDAIVKGKEPVGSAAWQYDGEGSARFYANAKILDSHCPGASKIIFTKGIPSGAVNSLSGTPFQYRSAQHLNNFKAVEKECNAKDAAFRQLTAAYDLNALLLFLQRMPEFNLHIRGGELRSTLKLPASISSYDSIVALVEEADHAFALKAQKEMEEKSRLNRFFAPPKKEINLLAAPHEADPHGLNELFGTPSGGRPRGGVRHTKKYKYRKHRKSRKANKSRKNSRK